ncbi:MAG: TIGR00282 family metallophosphoesterase [Clostridia bacterium]|nr:TIGR00282 family metallophosphoesterase [Clostridia bacterium]
MRVLAIGDIVAEDGREFVYNNLDRIRRQYHIDFCIANGENAANTNGITADIAHTLVERGVDVITMGNHTFAHKDAGRVLEDNPNIIRPLNFPPELEGIGWIVKDISIARVGVINLIGRTNMSPADCPFHAVERVLKTMDADVIFVDMHAEATSERIAMGHFLDGKVSAVFGTHTHVQTADERILPGGTGFIADLGMTGVEDSVLGVRKDIIVNFYYQSGKRFRFEKAEGEVWFHGCIFDVDPSTGKTTAVERLRFSSNNLPF